MRSTPRWRSGARHVPTAAKRVKPYPRRPKRPGAGERAELARAQQHYRKRAWSNAYEAFRRADQEIPLAAADLQRLALAAYLIGRDEEYLAALERAYNAHRDAGQRAEAVRCGFWL